MLKKLNPRQTLPKKPAREGSTLSNLVPSLPTTRTDKLDSGVMVDVPCLCAFALGVSAHETRGAQAKGHASHAATYPPGWPVVTSKGLRECLEKRTRKRKHSPILRGNNKKRAPTPLPPPGGQGLSKTCEIAPVHPLALYAYLKTLSRKLRCTGVTPQQAPSRKRNSLG